MRRERKGREKGGGKAKRMPVVSGSQLGGRGG